MSKAAVKPAPPSSVNGVEKAQAEVEKYTKVEQDLYQELENLIEKVRASEEGIGDRVLAAKLQGNESEISTVADEGMKAFLELDSIRKALKSASRAKEYARADVLHARADEKREEAVVLREEVRSRMEKTNKLLQELREHEGVLYQAPMPVHPSGAGYEYNKPSTRSGEIMMQAVELENEAKRLDEEAARIRQRAQAEYEKRVAG